MVRSPTKVLTLWLPILGLAACTTSGGSGGDGEFEADPASLNFGYVELGQATDPATITLTNNGTTDVEVQSVAFSSGAAEHFMIFQSLGDLPMVFEPGDDEEISIYFIPAASGVFDGSLDLALGADEEDVFSIPVGGCSTDPNCTVEVGDDDDDDDDDDDTGDDDVSGEGDIQVSPTAVSFGQVAMNQSPQEVVVISNVGSGPLDIESVSLSGSDASLFSFGAFNGGTVQPNGAPVNLTVTFDASTASLGAKSATLTIESDDPDEGTLSLALTADVVEDCGACQPVITVVGGTTMANPLGTGGDIVYVQVTTGTIDVTVRNDGFGTATINSVTEGGTILQDNPSIQYMSGAPLSLDAGDSGDLRFAVGQEGCEVVNFDGTYAFTMGTVAGGDFFALLGCMGGDSGLPFP